METPPPGPALDWDRNFPASAAYPQGGGDHGPAVRESVPAPERFPFTERHLQCLWFDATLRPAPLRTVTGETVEVLDPGRWNLEGGADFLDAAIRVGSDRRQRVGDVEVHLSPSDWIRHNHSKDPKYGRVILHVTYYPGRLPPETLPAGALELSLRAPALSNPLFTFDSIDLGAYPYSVRPGMESPCQTLLKTLPADSGAHVLRFAGEERLRRKTARFKQAIEAVGRDQALYEEFLCALGFKSNKAPFRLLADRLPLAQLLDRARQQPTAACALLAGVAGLLPARNLSRWDEETRDFVRQLWDVWWKHRAALEDTILPRSVWKLQGLRPHNHPLRRIGAAAETLCAAPDLAEKILAAPLSDGSPGDWIHAVSALLEGPAQIGYWHRHLTLGSPLQPQGVSLLGPARIASILTNVMVPFSAACGRDVRPVLPHLPTEEDNSVLRQTLWTLFGRDVNPTQYRAGLLQQGLIQIFQDFCLTSRAGCPQCPLAASLRNISSLPRTPQGV